MNKTLLISRLLLGIPLGTYLCASTSVYALESSALPQSGQVIEGSASIDYQNNHTLDIHQKSQNTIIEWQSFDIGEAATVNFLQPGRNALAVNRVLGPDADPSLIMGKLNANGRVMILDQNGIIFGQNSKIDVGSIIASTGEVSNADIMDGNDTFLFNNISDSAIELNGVVSIKDAGLAALVSKNVINNGLINAKLGKVALAGGDQVALDLYGDGLIQITSNSLTNTLNLENTGNILAEGGYITLRTPEAKSVLDSVINVSGIISASSATHEGGKVVLSGGHEINVSGNISASGSSGGEILIGGDYLGLGSTTHSQRSTIHESAEISANSKHSGNGGRVIVWSDNQTIVAGTIEAKGGEYAGDGGFIETSSKTKLNVRSTATVDASAPNGVGGDWLLDPRNVTIRDAAGTDASAGGVIDATMDNEVVDTSTIETALNNGINVTITTGASGSQSGVIVLEDSISKTAGGDAAFTLQAAENINISNYDADGNIPNITSTSGALDITLNADRDANGSGFIYISSATSINSNGGDITLGGGSDPLSTPAYGNALRDEGVTLAGGVTLNAGVGNISIRGQALNNPAANNLNGILSTVGSEITTTTGDIYLNGKAGDGVDNNRGIYLSNTTVSSVDGDITMIGQGGSNGAADSDNNAGVFVDGLSTVETTNNGNITVHGTGGAGEDANMGVYFIGLNVSLQTVDGDLSITGQGGSNGNATSGLSHGILFNSNAQVRSTGTGVNAGTITMVGTGSSGEDSNDGVIFTGGAGLTSIDGDITLTGYGGGTGAAGSNSNYGILINTGSEISSTGTGDNAANITINGTGGAGEDNNIGLYLLNSNADIKTVDGDINIVAQGGSIGNSGSNGGYGILMNSGGTIQSTGLGQNAGKINIQTTGGNGEDNNHGIYILGATSNITTIDGDISINASGSSNGTAASASNYGIFMNASQISSTGTGDNAANITINGTGGAGDDSNTGINLVSASQINSVDGDINIVGQGGSRGSSESNFNHGFLAAAGSIIKTTGTGIYAGNITLNGSSAIAHKGNRGAYFTGNNTRIQTIDGNINITGNAYYNDTLINATENQGIYLTAGAQLQSVNGNVSLTGYGRGDSSLNNGIRMISSGVNTAIDVTGNGNISLYGDGINASGLRLQETNTFIRSNNGNISLTGRANTGNNYGIYLINGVDILSTGSGSLSFDAIGSGSFADLNVTGPGSTTFGGGSAVGNLNIKANSMSLDADSILQTAGSAIFTTHSSTYDIGVGNAAGDLLLNGTLIDTLNLGNKLIVGDGHQDIHLDSVNLSSKNYNLAVNGRNITLENFVDVGKKIVMNATDLFTLNGRASSNENGDSLVLVAKRFINNFGKSALNSGEGRSLIYVSSLENTQAGGIDGDFYFARKYGNYPPSTIPGERTAFVFEALAHTYLDGNVENELSIAEANAQNNINTQDSVKKLNSNASEDYTISASSAECLVSEASQIYCTVSK